MNLRDIGAGQTQGSTLKGRLRIGPRPLKPVGLGLDHEGKGINNLSHKA